MVNHELHEIFLFKYNQFTIIKCKVNQHFTPLRCGVSQDFTLNKIFEDKTVENTYLIQQETGHLRGGMVSRVHK